MPAPLLIALTSRPDWIAEFGLVPADLFRHGGTTFLTSFLLHGGWWHLIGNPFAFWLLWRERRLEPFE